MPVEIPSVPNPQKEQTYQARGRRGRPMLFQITDPHNTPLFPYLLALHINPQNFDEKMMTSKTTSATRGGFVEWIWPDELDSISANASTGAFIGPDTGLVAGSDGRRASSTAGGYVSTPGRKETIAWERQQDLLELFHCNGMIFDGQGRPVIRGKVMCVYDRGIYLGHFTTFSVKENDEKAFSFELDWEFKVEATVYIFPGSQTKIQNEDSQLSGTVAPIANRVGLDKVGEIEREDIQRREQEAAERAEAERVRQLREEYGELHEGEAEPLAADQLTDKERAKLPDFIQASLVPSPPIDESDDQFTTDSVHFFDGERQDVLDAAAQDLHYENWTEYVQTVGPENAAVVGLEAMAGYESQIAGTEIEHTALERAARERNYESWADYEAAAGPGAARTTRLLALQDAYEQAQRNLDPVTFTPNDIASMRAQGLSEQDIAALQQAAVDANQQTAVYRVPQPDNVGTTGSQYTTSLIEDPATGQLIEISVPANQPTSPEEAAEFQRHLARRRGQRRTTEGEIEDYPVGPYTSDQRQWLLDETAREEGYSDWNALVQAEGSARAASIERYTVGSSTSTFTIPGPGDPIDQESEGFVTSSDEEVAKFRAHLERKRRRGQ